MGGEALLRWNHPHRGILTPDAFIELAEGSGEIANIGRWVLGQACELAATISRQTGTSMTIGVNVSASDFRRPGFADEVAALLEHAPIPAERLKLELTESVLVDDVRSAIKTLDQLHRTGVKSAIDDFGTGYSSLSYLQDLPVDVLKIDQSFIRDIGTDPRSEAIVQAVVALGQALGLDVVAEGIERAQQARVLRLAGCRRGQGYYFGRPLEPAKFRQQLEASNRLGGGQCRTA